VTDNYVIYRNNLMNLEDNGTKVSRNVGCYTPNDTVPHPSSSEMWYCILSIYAVSTSDLTVICAAVHILQQSIVGLKRDGPCAETRFRLS
jgi:hypothetical protein